MNRRMRRKIRKIRRLTVLVLALTVVMLLAAVGGTIAYLATGTDALVNTFTPGSVTCKVDETMSGATKSNVRIQNTGNTTAFIRAKVVGNWCNEAGEIVAPWTDNITYKDGWTEGSDGYYYYNSAVAGGGFTTNLFDSYTAAEAPVEGAHLEMTILCQAVQSEASGAKANDWSGIKTPTTGN